MTSFSVVGDAMVDVLVRIDRPISYGSDTPAAITHSPGGSAANTAAWLATLDHEVHLISATGDDQARATIVDGLACFGVIPHLQIVDGAATGTCIVLIDAQGERTMLPDAGANASLTREWCMSHLQGEHLHASAYPLFQPGTAEVLLSVLREARERGMTLSLDLASSSPIARHRELVSASCRLVDVVFANESEARALAEANCATTMEHLAEHLSRLTPVSILKMGPAGALGVSQAGRFHVPAMHTEVIDTTGAGDAFAAGFLSEWLRRADLATALETAVRTASDVLGRVGAGPARLMAGD